MTGTTTLILGGGVGGITAANMLRNQLPSEHRVIVVEKRFDYVFTPSLLWVMVGRRQPERITEDLRLLVRPGIELIEADVQEIDLDAQRVKTTDEALAYDYLVLALGADLAPETMPGFLEAARSPYDLGGAKGIWEVLQQHNGGSTAVVVSSTPYKCPAAPYETAMLLVDFFRRRGIRSRCKVDIFTPEILPMGVAGPEMGRAVVGMMAAKDIGFHPEMNLTHIDSERNELAFADREPIPFDLLVGVPPHQPPSVVKQSSVSNDAGWVPVDRRTLETRYENVYAIGDIAAVSLANGKPLPKAGVFAEGQGKTVARRIFEQIMGGKAQAEFDGHGFCWIEIGGGSAGFASGEFYAEPDPDVNLPRTGHIWHWGKILFEKYWLGKGLTRVLSRAVMRAASKVLGVTASF